MMWCGWWLSKQVCVQLRTWKVCAIFMSIFSPWRTWWCNYFYSHKIRNNDCAPFSWRSKLIRALFAWWLIIRYKLRNLYLMEWLPMGVCSSLEQYLSKMFWKMEYRVIQKFYIIFCFDKNRKTIFFDREK